MAVLDWLPIALDLLVEINSGFTSKNMYRTLHVISDHSFDCSTQYATNQCIVTFLQALGFLEVNDVSCAADIKHVIGSKHASNLSLMRRFSMYTSSLWARAFLHKLWDVCKFVVSLRCWLVDVTNMLQIIFENRMFRGRLVQLRFFLGALLLRRVITCVVNQMSFKGFLRAALKVWSLVNCKLTLQ